MNVAIVSVNDALFTDPDGEDASVLAAYGEHVDRVRALVVTPHDRAPRAYAANVEALPLHAQGRAAGLAAVRRAVRSLAGEADVVQAQEGAYTGLAALLGVRGGRAKLNVGVFGTDPWDPAFVRASAGHRAGAAVARAVLRRADGVQADSTVIVERLRARGVPARYKPMTPESLPRFLAAGERRAHAEQGSRLLFVGRLGRQKHLPLLLDAVAAARRSVPGVQLDVVGAGPDEHALRERAGELGLDGAVRFAGPLDRAALTDAMLAADLLVLASRYEGMPRVFLEAGATGLPIVSTPVAGALELGDLVVRAAPDATALGAAIATTLADRPRREQLGAGLREEMARRAAEGSPVLRQVAVWRELSAS